MLSEMEAVDSSAIKEIGYCWPYEALGVRFRPNPDSIYVYFDVPYDEYEDLIEADSIGRYFNQYIKGRYDGEKYPD